MEKTVVISQSLNEYFYELINEAVQHQQQKISENASFYLVNLLNTNSNIENNEKFEGKDLDDYPLALLFTRALASDIQNRIKFLKIIGDRTLYLSGFFGDSFNRKIVDIDYYIQLGVSAYDNLSSVVIYYQQTKQFSPLYKELGEKFKKLVDILGEVSDKCMLNSNEGVLRLYEKWLKTGSCRAEEQLKNQGIIPTTNIYNEYQQ